MQAIREEQVLTPIFIWSKSDSYYTRTSMAGKPRMHYAPRYVYRINALISKATRTDQISLTHTVYKVLQPYKLRSLPFVCNQDLHRVLGSVEVSLVSESPS